MIFNSQILINFNSIQKHVGKLFDFYQNRNKIKNILLSLLCFIFNVYCSKCLHNSPIELKYFLCFQILILVWQNNPHFLQLDQFSLLIKFVQAFGKRTIIKFSLSHCLSSLFWTILSNFSALANCFRGKQPAINFLHSSCSLFKISRIK
jgi:hypothetical protein